MNILTSLAGLVIGAVVAWQVVRGYAAAELNRQRAHLEEQIAYWQDEAERATSHATQRSEQTAAWVAGCLQGRKDVLSVARALAQHPTGTSDPSDAG
jgi:predicted neuraminidase